MFSGSCQPADRELNAGEEEPCLGAGDGRFEVLGQTPVAVEPGQGTFDHPVARYHFEALRGIGPLDDLQGHYLQDQAPNLSPVERSLLGLCTLFLRPGRIPKVAVAVKTSTLLKLHQYLVRRKYRALFSGRRTGRKPGPRGPSEELV